MIIKFLVNIVELVIISKILYKVAKFLITGKLKTKKFKGSILGKVFTLFSRRIHYALDYALKQQQKRLAVDTQQTTNIIELKEFKKAKEK